MADQEQTEDNGTEKGTGKFLGVHYDWRRPTAERFKERLWNPEDRRVFTPRAYGWGYSINFYRLTHPRGPKNGADTTE